jgi:hypothetical protein
MFHGYLRFAHLKPTCSPFAVSILMRDRNGKLQLHNSSPYTLIQLHKSSLDWKGVGSSGGLQRIMNRKLDKRKVDHNQTLDNTRFRKQDYNLTNGLLTRMCSSNLRRGNKAILTDPRQYCFLQNLHHRTIDCI